MKKIDILTNEFRHLTDELRVLSHELEPWYDVDKVKSYAVFVWTKGKNTTTKEELSTLADEDFGTNVFDIFADELVVFDDEHTIIENSKPVIKKLQLKLKEIESVYKKINDLKKPIEWKHIKPLKSVEVFDECERYTKYKLSDTFKECVIANNGGTPSKMIFDTDKKQERLFEKLLSFNHEDKGNIWDMLDWAKEDLQPFKYQYLPFGIDPFGNLIYFNINNDNIIFLNHESLEKEIVAKDFDEFISNLRSLM